jgi:hypothetical protein
METNLPWAAVKFSYTFLLLFPLPPNPPQWRWCWQMRAVLHSLLIGFYLCQWEAGDMGQVMKVQNRVYNIICGNFAQKEAFFFGGIISYFDYAAHAWEFYIYHTVADPSGRTVSGVGLLPSACWDRGFESYRGHGCFSLVQCLCCQVKVSVTCRSLVQRSPTDCGVCLSVITWK